ncbi:MAG: hypothetical protein QOG08_1832 [Chloroflexota bacterium]|nr:hypothetical protein [Chloroflexota bacterium]
MARGSGGCWGPRMGSGIGESASGGCRRTRRAASSARLAGTTTWGGTASAWSAGRGLTGRGSHSGTNGRAVCDFCAIRALLVGSGRPECKRLADRRTALATSLCATPLARCRRSSLPPRAPALREAKASTTLGASRRGPSRVRRSRSTCRMDRRRRGSFRIGAAAGRSGRTWHPRLGLRPSRAGRSADTGSEQRALAAAASSRFPTQRE